MARLIVTVEQPADGEGVSYTLTLPNGAKALITETGSLYAELAHVIDHAFGDCDDETCEDRLV